MCWYLLRVLIKYVVIIKDLNSKVTSNEANEENKAEAAKHVNMTTIFSTCISNLVSKSVHALSILIVKATNLVYLPK